MMNLRPYQNEAKLAILEQWSEGINKVLAVLPTGTERQYFSRLLRKNVCGRVACAYPAQGRTARPGG
ncbi:MAG: hypothetical protein ACLTCP_13545 [Ruminococcus bicirculans (ex Wegman et al. 2014)]